MDVDTSSLVEFPGQVLPEWASKPFRDFLDDMEELDKTLALAVGGIRAQMSALERAKWHETVDRLLDDIGNDSATKRVKSQREYARRRNRARETQAFAEKEAKTGFHHLYSLAAISVCSSMESTFQNFIMAWLRNHPESLSLDAVTRVKVTLAVYQSMSEDERYLYLVEQLENELKLPFREGASRYEDLLSVFGLGGPVDPETAKALFELNQVRNVLAHRRGIADRRFVEKCSWFGAKAGDRLNVGQDAFHRYSTAGMQYVTNVIMRLHRKFGEAGELNEGESDLEGRSKSRRRTKRLLIDAPSTQQHVSSADSVQGVSAAAKKLGA